MSTLRILCAGIAIAVSVTCLYYASPPAAKAPEDLNSADNTSVVEVDSDQTKNSDSSAETTTSSTAESNFDPATAIERLVQSGWDRNGAKAVISMNERGLARRARLAPELFDGDLAALQRLGPDQTATRQLAEFPELAGFLAESKTSSSNAASIIARAYASAEPEGRKALVNLLQFVFAESGGQASGGLAQIATILERYGANFIDAMTLTPDFQHTEFFRGTPAVSRFDRAYDEWVVAVIRPALKEINERGIQCEITTVLLENHNDTVARMLEADPGLADVITQETLPAVRRLLVSEASKGNARWAELISPERLFPFLASHQSHGIELLKEIRPEGIEIMTAPELKSCGDIILPHLKSKELSFYRCLSNPQLLAESDFVHLFERGCNSATRRAAVNQLASIDSIIEQRLKLTYWRALSNSALTDDLGPPPEGLVTWIPGHSIYELGKKKLQGREVPVGDYIAAGTDAASFIPIFKAANVSLKISSTAAKKAGMATAKKAGKKLVRSNVLAKVRKQAGSKAAATLSQNASKAKNKLWNRLTKKLNGDVSFDVTALVKQSFRNGPFGRTSLKKKTGLDARIFMRADRRVSLHFNPNRATATVVACILANAGVDAALQTQFAQDKLSSVAGHLAVLNDTPEEAMKKAVAQAQRLNEAIEGMNDEQYLRYVAGLGLFGFVR